MENARNSEWCVQGSGKIPTDQRLLLNGHLKTEDGYDDCKDDDHGYTYGSILEQLLFFIYISEIVHCPDNATFVLAADDTTVFITGNSEAEIEAMANKTVSHIDTWAFMNYLKISSSKTQVILYTPKGKQLAKEAEFISRLSAVRYGGFC